MRLHFAHLARLQAPIHVRQNPVFHSLATHNTHPSSIWSTANSFPSLPLYFITSLLHYFITSLLRRSITSSALPPTAPTPLANSHKPETATTSTHSPNTPRSSQSRCNPAPDTCAAAPPPAASPATSQSRAGSSSSALPPPDAARCPD